MVWYMLYLWREVEWVGHGRDTDEKHYEDFVEGGCQLASSEGSCEAVGKGFCIIII